MSDAPDWNSLYPQLRKIARQELRKHQRLTLLQTTDLAQEAWLRLSAQSDLPTSQRLSFLAYAARTVRSVIVDTARARMAAKRGGHAEHVALEDWVEAEEALSSDSMEHAVLALHDSLERLAVLDPELSQLVELRYFAGLSELEVAELTQRSRASVQRDWAKARAVLLELLDT